ncbi:MAG: hypothetical protein ACRDT4_04570 [Micromonosporaceae bacterium]
MPGYAIGVTELASTVTTIMVAVLTLVAALVVVVGLVRALRERRRDQLVIGDVAALTARVSADDIDVAGLSPLLRQGVLRWLGADRQNAEWIVKGLLGSDAALGRTPVKISVERATRAVTTAVTDSLDTLSKGLQAIAPEQAAGLVAAIGSLLPTPRGSLVRAYPVTRGGSDAVRLGLAVELSRLDRTPIAATTFWQPPGDGARAYQDEMIGLLEVAARWIAVRRVALRLIAAPIRRRWALPSAARRRHELGMQRLLASGLTLVAMKQVPQHALAFGEGVVEELLQAADELGTYHRPWVTLGGVHEQLGFAYRRDGDERQARVEFIQAARSWGEAYRLLRENPGSGVPPADLDDDLALLRIRRLKCLLLTGDSRRYAEARAELGDAPTVRAARTLFSAAVLYARAGTVLDDSYLAQAWRMLGLALLASHDDLIWEAALEDPELEPLVDRARFVDQLRPYRLAGTGRPDPDELIAAAVAAATEQPVSDPRAAGTP